MICGFDDGALCLMNLDKKQGKSLHRKVYRGSRDGATLLDQGIYDDWDE